MAVPVVWGLEVTHWFQKTRVRLFYTRDDTSNAPTVMIYYGTILANVVIMQIHQKPIRTSTVATVLSN